MRPHYEEGRRARADLEERAAGGVSWARVLHFARELRPYPAKSYAGRMWRRGFLAPPRRAEP